MARPRTPSAVMELTGAFKHDPQRRRENEPQPNGPIGNAPPHFEDELKAIWQELVDMVPARVLALSDRWLVELACRTMQQVRHGSALAAERNLLLACLSRMGLTPADRSRIAVSKKEEDIDELAKLAAECHTFKPS